jgi:sugar lactone lactonase YvrE
MFRWFSRTTRKQKQFTRQVSRRNARRNALAIERLETRLNPSTLIPVIDHRALVFDSVHDALYIATSHGGVQRFDLDTQTLMPAWSVGFSLNGADISADGTYLYVAENQVDATNHLAFIHQVNLADGSVIDLPFSLGSSEQGAWEVAVGSNGKALFSTAGTSGPNPAFLHQIDLNTDAISTRFDLQLDGPSARLARSADGSVVFVTAAGNIGQGADLLTYDATADRFSPSVPTRNTVGNSYPTVNRDGTLRAVRSVYPNGHSSPLGHDYPVTVSVLDRNFNVVELVPDAGGGMAFDPTQDVLYIADPVTDQVIAYDTNTWAPKYRLDIGEPLPVNDPNPTPLTDSEMAVSSDGRFLALATPSGVRLFDLPAANGVSAGLSLTGFPSLLAAGGTGTFTVSALDPAHNVIPGYTGTVHLTSSDPAAVFFDPATGQPLAGNTYTFQPGDQGTKAFTAVLNTGGTQSITAADVDAGFSATQGNITVHIDPTSVVPVRDHRALVYDPTRDLLYIVTSTGDIERYDVAHQALLAPFHVGDVPNDADITADGQFLYVTDLVPGSTEGVVHKVNLDTGAVTNLTYLLNSLQAGSYGIAVGPHGEAYFTTNVIPGAGSAEPLYRIDVASDAVTPVQNFSEVARVSRSADRSLFFFTDNGGSAGTLTPFDATTDCFLPAINYSNYITNSLTAVNRNGTLLALVLPRTSLLQPPPHVVTIYDTSFRVVRNLANADGGMAFDPVRNLLYVANPVRDQIIAYDTNTRQEQYAFDIGESIDASVPFGNGLMTVNADGTRLFLTTASGVRVFDLPQSTGVASHFNVSGFPGLIGAGARGTFTVTTLDPINNLVPGYLGVVHLSSSDPAAVFIDPVSGAVLDTYAFLPSDQGVKRFISILNTPGPQSITVTDVYTPSITGSQINIAVHDLPVTVFAAANHRDLVYDGTRGLLYVTTADGDVDRYDVVHQALLNPFHVGGSPGGADITPDGQFLYVADTSGEPAGGVIHKVNLDTGAVTDLHYSLHGLPAGSYSVVINANGAAIVTLTGDGISPFYRIDLATDTLSQVGVSTFQGIFAARGADRSQDVFTAPVSSGPASTYDVAADTFSPPVYLNDYLDSTSAVSRDGALIAVEIRGSVRILDRSLQTVHTLTGLSGGVAFDPTRDVLYAVSTSADQIQAFDTTTWNQLYAIPISEAVQGAVQYGNGMMTVSTDGNWLFLATVSGIRVYPLNGLVGTSVTLAASPTDSATPGQPVTFFATVRGGSAADRVGETVTFVEGSTILGTGTLNAAGQATFTTSNLAPGTHVITAIYGGDDNYNPSSGPLSYRIAAPLTPTVLTVTATPEGGSHFLEVVTFEVTVSGGNPADRAGESVSLYLPTGGPITAAGLDANGHATLHTRLNLGTNMVSIRYNGDSRYQGSSAGLTYVVSLPTVTLTFFSSAPSEAFLGQSVTFDATVGNWSPPSGGGPETVTFADNGVVLATVPINSQGHAAFTTAGLSLGGHLVSATYDGDSTFLGSTATTDFLVVQVNTVTFLQASPTGLLLTGQPVTFTATITGGNPADRVNEVVTFEDGGGVLGTSLLDGSGQAALTVPSLDPGSHVITAVYGGDATYHGGTRALTVAVSAAPQTATAAALSYMPFPSIQTAGQAITFTAVISGGTAAARAGETVTFLDRNTVIGTGILDANGQATFITSSLSVGGHTITAAYTGDDAFRASSAAVSIRIVPASLIWTVTTLSASPAGPATLGHPVTFTAAVGYQGIHPQDRTGLSVTFRDGDTVLGTVPLDSSDRAVFTTAGLGLGGHKITATFNGNDAYQASCGEVLYQVTSAGTTVTALALAVDVPGPTSAGQPVTFTAMLTGGDIMARAGETVTFYDGATVLGTGTLDAFGNASFTTSSLVAGVHHISAVYLGDLDALGSSDSLSYTIVIGE